VKKALLVTILLLLAVMLLVRPTHSTTTTLTGTIKDSQGNPLNGTLILQLPVPAQDTTTNTLVANTPITYRVVSGAILSGSSVPLYDVANLQPQNLYYSARVYDSAGTLVFSGNYPITGASYNIGAAAPTSVTTSNISYINPVATSATNVFTVPQTFMQINSSNTPIAGSGFMRLGSTDTIAWRNNANSLDVVLAKSGAASGNLPADNVSVQGGTSGLAAAFFSPPSTATAVGGLYRLQSTDTINWRNAANSGDVSISKDGSDHLVIPIVGGYNGSFTAGQGIPVIDAVADATAQGANIAPATLINAPSGPFAPALFRVTAYIIVTQAATTSSTLPSVVLTWTDRDNNTAQTFTLTPTNAGNLLTTLQQASMVISPKAVTNINYSTTGYASVGGTSMQYAVHIRVEAM